MDKYGKKKKCDWGWSYFADGLIYATYKEVFGWNKKWDKEWNNHTGQLKLNPPPLIKTPLPKIWGNLRIIKTPQGFLKPPNLKKIKTPSPKSERAISRDFGGILPFEYTVFCPPQAWKIAFLRPDKGIYPLKFTVLPAAGAKKITVSRPTRGILPLKNALFARRRREKNRVFAPY